MALILMLGTVPTYLALEKWDIIDWDLFGYDEEPEIIWDELSGLWVPTTTFNLGGGLFSSKLHTSDSNYSDPFLNFTNPQTKWLPIEFYFLCQKFGPLTIDSVLFQYLYDEAAAFDLQLLIGSYNIYMEFDLTAPDNSTYSYHGGVWKFLTFGGLGTLQFIIPKGLENKLEQNGTFYLDLYMKFNVVPSILLSLTGEDLFENSTLGPLNLNFTK